VQVESRSVYSIGAVSSMLDVPPATLRTWEERYEVISPARTAGGHRLYSRDQVEHLRFVVSEIDRGLSAADAHRELEQRLRRADSMEEARDSPPHRLHILVAERDAYSADLIENLLRMEGFHVEVTLDVGQTKRRFEREQPHLSVVEFLIGGGAGERLCGWLRANGTAPILVISALDAADRALGAGADAFLAKPLGRMQFVAAVKSLLGVGAALQSTGSVAG
jgi:DNA-binding transcriptional MerR regulator